MTCRPITRTSLLMHRRMRWILILVAAVTAEQSCHPRTGQCHPEPPPQPRPHIWVGRVPMCNVDANTCKLYGLDYDVSHPRGPLGADWCLDNNKVRCVSPDPPSLAPPSPSNTLVAITYNIWERDFYISNDGQRERTCRIPRWLALEHPDVDVIGFQEAFMGGCDHTYPEGNLRSLLRQHGFQYYTEQLDSSMKPQPGGIFIASRWPIVEEEMYIFKANDPSWDFFAAKGISYAKILKTGSDGHVTPYHVMSTHLIAAKKRPDTRRKQVEEWRAWVVNRQIPHDEAVLYMGDINEDMYKHPELLDEIWDTLHATMVTPMYGQLNYSAESIWNDVRINDNPNGGNGWIDHHAYSKDHLQPIAATEYPVHAKVETPFPVCWCAECKSLQGYKAYDHPRCPAVVEITHLADHNPVVGRFTFPSQ